jgi:hypothetical protein
MAVSGAARQGVSALISSGPRKMRQLRPLSPNKGNGGRGKVWSSIDLRTAGMLTPAMRANARSVASCVPVTTKLNCQLASGKAARPMSGHSLASAAQFQRVHMLEERRTAMTAAAKTIEH